MAAGSVAACRQSITCGAASGLRLKPVDRRLLNCCFVTVCSNRKQSLKQLEKSNREGRESARSSLSRCTRLDQLFARISAIAEVPERKRNDETGDTKTDIVNHRAYSVVLIIATKKQHEQRRNKRANNGVIRRRG